MEAGEKGVWGCIYRCSGLWDRCDQVSKEFRTMRWSGWKTGTSSTMRVRCTCGFLCCSVWGYASAGCVFMGHGFCFVVGVTGNGMDFVSGFEQALSYMMSG